MLTTSHVIAVLDAASVCADIEQRHLLHEVALHAATDDSEIEFASPDFAEYTRPFPGCDVLSPKLLDEISDRFYDTGADAPLTTAFEELASSVDAPKLTESEMDLLHLAISAGSVMCGNEEAFADLEAAICERLS